MTDLIGEIKLKPVLLNDVKNFDFDNEGYHTNIVLKDSVIFATISFL